MCHKKRKLTKISGAKSGTGTPQKYGSMTLFYPISIILQIFFPKIPSYFNKLKMQKLTIILGLLIS